jgi:hypothetical protein
MSVLSFPRIYLKGYAEWDPCTFNNNDWQAFQTYDAANAALNWPFLATLNPPITPGNFGEKFRDWAIRLQNDNTDQPPGPRVPCEWNMFGSHAVSFAQYKDKITTITGGDAAYGQPVTDDPLIGLPVSVQGDGGSGPGRLVDTNPASFWSSQIYYGALQFGGGRYSIAGPRVARMHSRWINLSRLYSPTKELTQPAAAVACCFQACIGNGSIVWRNDPDPVTGATSQLIASLEKAAAQPGAKGVMLRFSAYVNLYFQNGIFNDSIRQARNYRELAGILADVWAQWHKSGDPSQFFSQPCYSHVVGAIGVWNDGELASVPGGRYLVPGNPVTPVRGTKPIALGPVAAEVDYERNLISLDFGSAIPEIAIAGTTASDLIKADFGTLTLGTIPDGANGAFTPVAGIDYAKYQRSAYEASAGIIDIPFPDPGTAAQLRAGQLAIQVQGQSVSSTAPDVRSPLDATVVVSGEGPLIALTEQVYSAQTDSRGIYLDEGERKEFQVRVLQAGAPAVGASVLVAKFDNNLSLIPTTQPQFVNFANGRQQIVLVGGMPTSVTLVATDQTGTATVAIMAQSPGFPVLGFFPFAAGKPMPQLPSSLFPPGPAFYTTVRVLPFDSSVPGQFIDLWNSTHDPAQAWIFVYNNILYIYDMIFSVMLEYVNLGSRDAVEASAGRISALIAKDVAAESTVAMPVTRDLSDGKRAALRLWLYLVKNKYQVDHLSLAALGDSRKGETAKGQTS